MAQAALKEGSFVQAGHTSDISIGKKSLPAEIDGFLEKCEWEVLMREAVSDTRSRVPVITKTAGEFEKAVKDLDETEILLSENNRERLREVRESMGEDFADLVVGHYKSLEENISVVIRKIQTRGITYIMNGQKYNEEIAEDLDKIVKLMTFGYRELNNNILEIKSKDYAKVSVDVKRKISEEYRIGEILQMLTNSNPIDKIKEKMLELIKNSLHYMHDEIAGQNGLAISKLRSEDNRRGLDKLRERVLQHLEFLLNLVTRSAHVARNIRIQRILLGKCMEHEEDALISA